MSSTKLSTSGISLSMHRGPYQNNGASPWYAEAMLGTPGQRLRFAIDTGTNMVWTTSTLCAPTSCQHYSGNRFDYKESSTFRFVDCISIPFSFGPWGTMQVETGHDILGLPNGPNVPMNIYLSSEYSGSQFAQLDWDGGIGIPSGSPYKQGGTSFIVQDMMNAGMISPQFPYVSFDWDARTTAGSCILGGYDEKKFLPEEGIFMPWYPYQKLGGVEYIWTTYMNSYRVGNQVVATDAQFALDSGSSQFKGDNYIMDKTLELLKSMNNPPVTIVFDGSGTITITPEMYNVTIQAGPDTGKTLPQFHALGLTDLVLVGSVLMESCYTIFYYRVVQCGPNTYSLAPVGMLAFNKVGGPKVITRSTPGISEKLGSHEVVRGRTMR